MVFSSVLASAQEDLALHRDLAEAAELTGLEAPSLQGLALPENASEYQLAKAEAEPATSGTPTLTATEKEAALDLPAKDLAEQGSMASPNDSTGNGADSETTKMAAAPVAAPKADAADENQPLQLPAQLAKSEASELPIVKLILFSLVGVGFCVGLFQYLRKRRTTPALRAGDIKIISQTFLGPKRSVAVLRVAGESVLVGVTDHNINLIKTLSLLDEEIPQETPRKFDSLITKGAMDGLLEDEEEHFEYNGLQNAVVNKIKSLKGIGQR